MIPIPAAHKKIISTDLFFKRCLLCPSTLVEIHHCWIVAGCQIAEIWAYSPLCNEHHTGKTGFHCLKAAKEKVEWILINRMTEADMAKYPRIDWKQKKKYLDSKFR